MNDFDVMICGLGPTGATLAGLLGQRGLRVAVFDRLPDLYPLPRAIGLDQEAMRIVQELGVADRVSDFVAPYRPSEYLGVDGALIKRLDTLPEPHMLGWAPNYVFDQPAFERAMRARLGELDNVRVFLETELVDFDQEAGRVWVDLRSPDGATKRFSASYLVACDGGSSPIRKRLGIELEDLGFDEPWLVVDAIVPAEKAASLPQTQIQYCEPERPATYVVGPGNHRRWEIMLLPGDSLSPEFPDEELWPLLQRWLKPGEARIWRAAAYRFHGLVAREWRRGHILLAGDAAHMTPPFMAQGMVQGMRDAQNLGWKLARVIEGQSADCLLDSYMDERRPHVVQTTLSAMALGRVICERDPEKARARDAGLRDEQGGGVKTVFRQQMIPDLAGGMRAPATAGAGSLFPQPEVVSGGQMKRLDDVTGAGVRMVVAVPMASAECDACMAALAPLDGALVCLDDCPDAAVCAGVRETTSLLADWFKSLDACVAIVRPDHYVYGTAKTVTEGLALLAGLRDALSRS